jgi:hypothetical protein
MLDNDEPERVPTNTFSSVLRPGSMTIKNEPLAVLFQFVVSPVMVAVVSLLVIALVSVHAGAAPAYDLRIAYATISPNPVLNAS